MSPCRSFLPSLISPLTRSLTPTLPCTWLQIIQVNLTSDNAVLVTEGAALTFTYSVNWVPSSVPFQKRFQRYLDYSFFEHKVGCMGA